MMIRPELLALLVILVFAVIFLLVFRAGRRMVFEKKHLLLTLGYELVTTRPSRLISRAESLYERSEPQSIQIDQVYSKQNGDQEFYIFDVRDNNKDDGQLGSNVFGLISGELALPRFSLTTLPGFSNDTLLGGIMESLLNKVLSYAEKYRGLRRIELPDLPDFDERVVLFGKDELAVNDLMKRVDLRAITRIETPVHISGMDDFLTVDFTEMGPLNEQKHDLIDQHGEFTRIARNFMN